MPKYIIIFIAYSTTKGAKTMIWGKYRKKS